LTCGRTLSMDKNKIIEAAAKLVAKGAYDKAIKEYRRILDADPKDVRILQKMGELFQKKNDNEQAAKYFTKVAESYSSDGFFLKSVALYKQVLKLDPSLLEVNLRLAELHQQLQLVSEATSYYQIVAQQHEKSGNIKGSLDTLKRIIELDPENVSSRIKLGEMYARGHMQAEAGNEFRRAAEYLKRNGRMEEYQRVLDRLSSLDSDDLTLAREVAQSYLAKGDAKRAIAKLQQCFQADPQDEQTLSLLADAFTAIGQVSKTISVYKELAKVYASQNRTAEENQLWAKIEQLDPADPDLPGAGFASSSPPPNAPVARSAPIRAAPAPASSAPQSSAAPPLAPPKPTSEQLAKLLKETDVYVKYGLHDKALEHLGKIFSSDPENLDAHEKAYQVYLAAGNEHQAAEQLLNVLRLCTRLNAVDRAQPYLNAILQQNPDHPEVATFVSVLGREDTAVESTDIETVPDDAILVDAADEDIVVPEPPDEVVDLSTDDLALQASINGDEAVDDEVFTPFNDEELVPASTGMNAALPTVIVDESELGGLPPNYDLEEDTAEWDSANQSSQAPLAEELIPEYDVIVEDSEDGRPEADGIEVEIDDADASAQVETVASAAEEPEADSAAEECEEARFFLEQGLLEDAREILETVLIAYPGHSVAQELLARTEREINHRSDPGVLEIPPEGKDAFDLAAELASELGEVADEQTTDGDSAADDFQYSVDDVFAEFKRGLEKVVRPEDVDTHYDLGIAYREMGLMEDAIGEFIIARQGCVGKKKEIDCLTMIALLQKGKGDVAGAIESYKRALMSEHAVGEVEKALEFELGAAWEDLGNAGKALYHYARVAKLDAQYRDVATIVSSLSLSTAPEMDALPSKRTAGSSSGVNGANGILGRGSEKAPGGKTDEARADRPASGKTRKGKAGFI
jgi:pilus assembly protein FimV